MNRTAKISRRTATAAALIAVLVAASVGAVEAPKKAPAAPVEVAKVNGPVHPALQVALPQSQFVDSGDIGRDPFFPNSTRRVKVAPKTEKSVVPTVDRSSLLTLRGVSGPPEKRIALINNMTFVAGEELAVKTSAGPMKIRVVSVGEKTAQIVIEGELTPRELKLRETISNAIQIHTSKVD